MAVLVSGMADLAADVGRALRAHGAEVTEVHELGDVPTVCAAAGPDSFESYVQLPAQFSVEGSTAITRVHHFYAEGVLARYPALNAALPTLTKTARLIFVMGVLPAEVATTDDREARQSLIRLLGHAARADARDTQLAVRVLDGGSTAEEIALAGLGRKPSSQDLLKALAHMSYEDFRVEIFGLMSMQT